MYRFIALILLPVALLAGLAAFTVTRGQERPFVAEVGAIFDSTAKARLLRSAVAASISGGTDRQIEQRLASLTDPLRETVRKEPINYPAFTALALVMKETDDARYEQFIESAVRASPRTQSLLALHLERAARDGDQIVALALLDRTMRLRPARMREIMPQFVAQVAGNSDSFDLEQSLKMKPLWAPMFLSLAADEPGLLRRVADVRIENPSVEISNLAIDAKIIERLAAAGDYVRAWRIFRLHRKTRSRKVQSSTRFAPFDWSLTSEAAQTASIDENGGLEIDFLTGGGEAASQVLLLDQSKSRLTADVVRIGPGKNDVFLNTTCVDGSAGENQVVVDPDTSFVSLPTPRNCRFARFSISTERRYSTVPTIVKLDNLTLH